MKNRNQENSDHWKTPRYVFEVLNKEFNFDFDPCPLHNDIEKWDGLREEWGGTVAFVNP